MKPIWAVSQALSRITRNQGVAFSSPPFQMVSGESLLGRLRHMQCPPHGIGERSCDAHGIILLEPRDGISHLWSKYAVNGAAVIAQSAQRSLHRTDIRRIHNQLFGGLEVVTPSPAISRREVGRVDRFPLMEQSIFVSLGQWVCRTKNIVGENVVFVGLRHRCAKAEN